MATAAPLNANDVRLMFEAACAQAGGQRAWAARRGISSSIVNMTLRGERESSEAIANALGLIRKNVYFPMAFCPLVQRDMAPVAGSAP